MYEISSFANSLEFVGARGGTREAHCLSCWYLKLVIGPSEFAAAGIRTVPGGGNADIWRNDHANPAPIIE